MCTTKDVANFFIDTVKHSVDTMTNMKINKLMFFAQGWSLALLNRPLFNEAIQAWKFGPVVPSVYQAFKYCGKNNIEITDEDYLSNVFKSDEFELLINVFAEYSKYSTSRLVALTHMPNTPWSIAYESGKNNIIPNESIQAYFKTLEPLKSFNYNIESSLKYVAEEPLPADWNDDCDEDWEELFVKVSKQESTK